MAATTAQLIDSLSTGLAPAPRLWSPLARTACWVAIVAAIAVGLAQLSDLAAVRVRLMAAPDMWLGVAGSVLTTILAAYAALQTALPDRSPRWAWLPVPAFLLWIGASGLGCLRPWAIARTSDLDGAQAMRMCLTFVVGISVPLALVLLLLLRRACALRPGMTTALAGLSCAAAAASLLVLLHPHDATAADLLVHLAAVALVVGVVRGFASRIG